MKRILLAFVLTGATLFGEIKAVVFDYGGVVAHADRQHLVTFLKKTFHTADDKIDDAVASARKVHNSGGSELGFWEDFASECNVTLPDDWMKQFKNCLNESVKLDDSVLKLIAELKEKNVTVALLTNSHASRAKVVEKLNLFDPIILAGEFNLKKPDPKVYEITLDKLGLSGDECLVIDNKQANIESAAKCNMATHLFTSSEELKQVLQEAID